MDNDYYDDYGDGGDDYYDDYGDGGDDYYDDYGDGGDNYYGDGGDEDYDDFGDEDYGDEDDEGYGVEETLQFDQGYIPSNFGRDIDIGGRDISDTPKDISIKRAKAIINSSLYYDISNELKKSAVNIIENLPENRLVLYNLEILVPASLVVAMKNPPSNKEIEKFLKLTNNLKNVNHLDLIRYIRILSK